MSDIVTQEQRLLEAGVVMSQAELSKYFDAPDDLGDAPVDIVPMGYKKCGGCNHIKKFYMFNRNSAAKNKCTGNCKECQKKASKKSYDKNKGTRDYKAYYRKNKERKQAHSRAYYEAHKEELKEKHKQYRNSAAGQKVMKKAHRKRRRLLKRNQGIPYTRELVIDRDKQGGLYPICYLCNKPITDHKIHLDHVIPVVLKGKDCFTNIACVHETCNLKKSKDAREITTEQVKWVYDLAESYIEKHPESFPSIFEESESNEGVEETTEKA